MANLNVKYPERKRCVTCRNYLTEFDAYEGLYCSWNCGPYEGPIPMLIPVQDLPRQCRKWDRQKREWSRKAVFRYEEDAAKIDPNKQPYFCEIHHAWHIGRPRRSS